MPATGVVEFSLNAAFEPQLSDAAATLERLGNPQAGEHVHRYRLRFTEHAHPLTLKYAGTFTQPAGDYARGHIAPQGVYLSGAALWYPRFGDTLVSFSLKVTTPKGWTAISQGIDEALPAGGQRWRETRPQEEIVLVAGRWFRYGRKSNGLDARVYLRRPDAALAKRYLETTVHYVDLYSRMLGPYPYEKYALAENFWETGYGMPSFALLGPRVIRFPFILHSSHPHEILHNWWGNGVYIDYGGGNWAEGLTAYLADHLAQEQRGLGAAHRRTALQKYLSYVGRTEDFPLSAFRGKHGEVSQAVGYNKSLMFFHMLRRRLGDTAFLDGLRLFEARNRFKRAGFADLRAAFESAGRVDLEIEFEQWVSRVGAPALEVTGVHIERDAEGYRLKGVLEQGQPEAPYRLLVPVAVQIEGRALAFQTTLLVTTRRHPFDIALSARPIALHVDPQFDLFRRLAPAEVPPSLGDLFAAKDPVFVISARDDDNMQIAYRKLAEKLGAGATALDSSLAQLPEDRAVWLLGWDNAHLRGLADLLFAHGVAFTADGVRLDSEMHQRNTKCIVLVARRSDAPARPAGFIGCDNPKAMAGLARKLPHYDKYSYLGFKGDAPSNVLKGQWPVRNSPMTIVFDPELVVIPPPLQPRTSLAGGL